MNKMHLWTKHNHYWAQIPVNTITFYKLLAWNSKFKSCPLINLAQSVFYWTVNLHVSHCIFYDILQIVIFKTLKTVFLEVYNDYNFKIHQILMTQYKCMYIKQFFHNLCFYQYTMLFTLTADLYKQSMPNYPPIFAICKLCKDLYPVKYLINSPLFSHSEPRYKSSDVLYF